MMTLGKEPQNSQNGYGPQTGSTYPGQALLPYQLLQQNESTNTGTAYEFDESAYSELHNHYVQNPMMSLPQQGQHRNPAFRSPYPHSPASNDGRRNQQSSYGSTDGASTYSLQSRAPSRGSLSGNVAAGQTLALDRRLRGLQQEQQGLMPAHPNSMQFRPPFANPYDFHTQNALRMNPLQSYYPVPPMANLLPQVIPRGPAKDQDTTHSTRSACLEEFRSNSKTNKRYELKVRVVCRASVDVLRADPNRTSTSTSSNLVAISTAQDSSNQSSRRPTVMRKIRLSGRFFPMLCSS